MKHHLSLFGITLALACSSDANKGAGAGGETTPLPTDDTGGPGPTDDTGEPDPVSVDVSIDQGPCADGGWGLIAEPEATLHVSGDVDGHTLSEAVTAIGTMDRPFRTLAELEAFLMSGEPVPQAAIALWPGTHQLSAHTAQVLATAALPVQSCGPEGTVLEAGDFETSDGGGPSAAFALTGEATLELDGFSITALPGQSAILLSDTASLSLTNASIAGDIAEPAVQVLDGATLLLLDTTIDGGRNGIWTEGAGASLTVERSAITGTAVAGIWTEGAGASLTATDTTISNAGLAGIWTEGAGASLTNVRIEAITGIPGLAASRGGWGLVTKDATVEVDTVQIQDVQRAGLAMINSSGSINNLQVKDVAPTEDGKFGRGVQIASPWDAGLELFMTNVEVKNVSDVGIFIKNMSSVYMSDVWVENVAAATYEIEPAEDDEAREEDPESLVGFGVPGLVDGDDTGLYEIDVDTGYSSYYDTGFYETDYDTGYAHYYDTGFYETDPDVGDVEVADTGAPPVEETRMTETGDGIIIAQRGWPGGTIDEISPDTVSATLEGENHFTAIGRAGIIADGVALSLNAPASMDAGYLRGSEWSVYAQHCGTLSWLDVDESEAPDATTSTSEGELLDYYDDAMDMDPGE